MNVDNGTYQSLRELVEGRDYQILTTNVDHQFQIAGFEKERLFYTQGDYGLLQCSKPCHHNTYDNEEVIRKMLKAQGYVFEADGKLTVSPETTLKMEVPSELIPHCPVCHRPMSMNLRADGTFVEDSGWHAAAERYQSFLDRHRKDNVLFLELGVGYNTPGIIKYPFWQMTFQWKDAFYVCVNHREAFAPKETVKKSLCIEEDIREVLQKVLEL